MSTDILQWLVFCRSVGGLTLIVCSHFGTMNQVRKFLGGLVYLHVQVPRSSSCGCCCSVAKSCLTLQPCGLQHSGLPCSSLSPGVCSHSCLLSQWCDLTISSSAAPFFSCPQSFPVSGLFQWVSSLHQVAKVLELQLQHQSCQWTFRINFL